MLLRLINWVVQAVSVLAVLWLVWQVIQDRMTTGLLVLALGLTTLAIGTQYLVLRREKLARESTPPDLPPGRLR